MSPRVYGNAKGRDKDEVGKLRSLPALQISTIKGHPHLSLARQAVKMGFHPQEKSLTRNEWPRRGNFLKGSNSIIFPLPRRGLRRVWAAASASTCALRAALGGRSQLQHRMSSKADARRRAFQRRGNVTERPKEVLE